jgi:hypothetical protein
MKKCLDSQRAWVEQVGFYELMNAPDYALGLRALFPGQTQTLSFTPFAKPRTSAVHPPGFYSRVRI